MPLALTNNLQTLEVKLDGAVTANELEWVVTIKEFGPYYINGLSKTLVGLTSGATPVTMVPAFDEDKTRYVEITEIHIFNADTTAENVTVQLNHNGTVYRIHKTTGLSADAELQYVGGDGFIVA